MARLLCGPYMSEHTYSGPNAITLRDILDKCHWEHETDMVYSSFCMNSVNTFNHVYSFGSNAVNFLFTDVISVLS